MSGSGVARDGSPVEVYRRLPPAGEAEIVHGIAPPGAGVLELGSGAGRVTRALAALGHPVVAVDESAEMLAQLAGEPGVETVRARIEELDLGRRFPVVLLGSHLVNSLPPERDAMLRAAVRHADAEAVVPIEVYPPAMEWVEGGASRLGSVEVRLEEVAVDGRRVRATVAYEVAGRRWRQPFEAEMLDEAALSGALDEAGLAFDRWLDEDRGWALARPRSGVTSGRSG